tara:strand:+ start:104 stop:265 length:162 start_codon:yes stop_codon:yes gene_type:complete
MNKILIIIVIFLTSCSKEIVGNNFDFNQELTLEEFKLKLNEYTKNSSYPNIDE